jgi:hypothetical protein
MKLLQEIEGSGAHGLAVLYVSGELAQQLIDRCLPVRTAASAEEAAYSPESEAVIVAAATSEECVAVARNASQAGKPVIVFPPDDVSAATVFELLLLLEESTVAVVPVMARSQLSSLEGGRHQLPIDVSSVRQVQLDVALPAVPEGDQTSERAERQLRDAMIDGLDWIDATGLKYSQITVLDSRATDGSLLSRLVTLNAGTEAERPLPPATLTIRPSVDAVAPPALRVIADSNSVAEFAVDPHRSLLPTLTKLMESRETCSAWLESFASTLELSEAAGRSLRRRRTVDVHFDSGSERGVFKSQMTAIGCGVLSFMLISLVALLIAGRLLNLPDRAMKTLRVLWLAPLVLFLLLQFLLPLTRSRQRKS